MRVRMSSLSLVFMLACGGARATAGPNSPEAELGVVGAVAVGAAAVGAAVEAEGEGALVSVRPRINDPYLRSDAAKVWSGTLERERREVIARREEIVAALELRPGMVVADIGAGTGAFMAALSVASGVGGRVYVVDIIPGFLAHLRQRAAAVDEGKVVVVEGSATATNLPDQSVDLLFLCDVYHHIEYPAVYLRSLHRTLRDDGRLVIVELDKVPGKTSAAMMQHVRQDKPTLLAELRAAGFVLEREVDTLGLKENYMLVFRK